ncbi:MAG: class I SAM-dependent methyltransferase [Chloroflexi bacterium]|nr:class I SAM-dependent methyltransferase [Chloroflexota bacterium]MCY3582585.1 class I SAM-dependent methyltransferase [Chloroflexota bacterium]MCY3717569.1 class I SAM-dependent methyltransferase [Chloroflexota bacterium]MDE2651998.1 class I SAM-dependent methyltransferase [Chloroflexota bacterium]
MACYPVHFYHPIPDTGALDDVYRSTTGMAGIDWRENEQLQLARDVFPRYAEEFRAFNDSLLAETRFAGNKPEFVGYDPYVYHCMIRHFQPSRIVEVGAGYSTVVASHAARLNGDANITAIEPYPNAYLASIADKVQVVRQMAQAVDLDFFRQLESRGILFIDSSHVVKTGSDVCYLVLEALQILQSGVLVHFHDIFLPSDYPRHWLTERRVFWNEQYLVQAWLAHNQRAKIRFANRYMAARHQDLLTEAFPHEERQGGGSLWVQV